MHLDPFILVWVRSGPWKYALTYEGIQERDMIPQGASMIFSVEQLEKIRDGLNMGSTEQTRAMTCQINEILAEVYNMRIVAEILES